MSNDNENKVQVRFSSRSSDIALSNVLLYVPVTLKRYGLSEIVQHLLSLETLTPFEFLIDGKLLVTDLQTFLDEKGWSTENILDIEVIHATRPPQQASVLPHSDWISAAMSLPCGKKSYILSSEFSGTLNVWASGATQEPLHSFPLDDAPIKNMDTFATTLNEPIVFVAQGFTASAYKIHLSKKAKSPTLLQTFGEHQDTVECVAYHQHAALLATGSWDRSIKLWKCNPEDWQSESETTKVNKRKSSNLDQVSPASYASFSSHAGAVHTLLWKNASRDQVLVSGSWDHSIRFWDTTVLQPLDTLMTNATVFSLDYSESLGYLASGHGDHHVRVWDTRQKDKHMTLRGHAGFVNRVQWSQFGAPYSLYSVSHDGTLKVWDIRSASPLHSLSTADATDAEGQGKLFALAQCDGRLYVGGERGQLVQYTV